MYIESIISCRGGYEKLRQRTALPDGIGPRQRALDVYPEQRTVFEELTHAIDCLQVTHTRVDHSEFMDSLQDGAFPEPSGRLAVTPRASSMCWTGEEPGKVCIQWSSDIALEDGRLENVKNSQVVLPPPPSLVQTIEHAWRDMFLSWEDTALYAHSLDVPAQNIGLVRDGVAVNLMLGRTMFDSWLFQRVPVAVRRRLVDLAVGVFIQSPRADGRYLSRVLRLMSGGLLRAEHNLRQLQPISLDVPFVLIGLSPYPVETPKSLELLAEPVVAHSTPVIERVIEVPAQYQQAVLGILGYFGTYLQQVAPECANDATIRIEQGTGFLRLVVEAENGARHVVERAFEDYQGVVSGDLSISQLVLSPFAAAELKNEIRLAQARIEFQQDMIAAQGLEIKTLRELSLGLARRSAPEINVQVSNVAHASSAHNVGISEMVDGLRELASVLQNKEETRDVARELSDLGSAIETAARVPTELAPPLSQLRKLLDGLQSGGSKLHTILQKTAGAVDAARKLAGRYNAIAEWCGLPQVPRPFTD